jgi:hypothetical protein
VAQGTRDGDAEALAVGRRFAAAWSARDLGRLMDLFGEDVVVFTGDRFVRAHERATILGRPAIEAWLRAEWAQGGVTSEAKGFAVQSGVVSWTYGIRTELDRRAGLPALEVTALAEVRDGSIVRFEPTGGTTSVQRAALDAVLQRERPTVPARPLDTQARTTPSLAFVVGGLGAAILAALYAMFRRPAV